MAEDGTPYSFHITVLDRVALLRFEYTPHRETVYCIEGSGTITDLATGETVALEPVGCTRQVSASPTRSLPSAR